MSFQRTLVRPCNGCLPPLTDEDRARGMTKRGRADFDYEGREADGRLRYECRNCGHVHLLRPRPAMAGGQRQERVIEQVRRLAGTRPVKVLDGYKSTHGEIYLVIEADRWYLTQVFVTVGARGALEARYYETGKKDATVERGRRAWTVIEVYGAPSTAGASTQEVK